MSRIATFTLTVALVLCLHSLSSARNIIHRPRLQRFTKDWAPSPSARKRNYEYLRALLRLRYDRLFFPMAHFLVVDGICSYLGNHTLL